MRAPTPLPPRHAPLIPGVSPRNGFAFRAGQSAFLRKLHRAWLGGEREHLGVFVPGYGKTITAITAYLMARAVGLADRLVVFVPRGNLRDQYTDAESMSRLLHDLGARPLGFSVADGDRVFLKNAEAADVVVSTYQYAITRGGRQALGQYCAAHRVLIVLDEVHHLVADAAWSGAVASLPCYARIGLSGTPVRSDGKRLFGMPQEVRYEEGQAVSVYRALHEVTLRQAHAEGKILKRIEAHLVDYVVQMIEEETGKEILFALSELREAAWGMEGSASESIDRYLARRKLRFHDVYLQSLIGPALERLMARRVRVGLPFGHPDAPRMLCLAMSNRHAEAMLAFLRARYPGLRTERIGQDLAAAHCAHMLEGFKQGAVDVLLAVDMIGEGTDIGPISVIVKADLVRAKPKTMQQVFRGMRYVASWPARENVCDVYASCDTEVSELLEHISEEVALGSALRMARASEGTGVGQGPPNADPEASDPQWSIGEVGATDLQTHALAGGDGTQQLYVKKKSYCADEAFEAAQFPARSLARDLAAEETTLRAACQKLAGRLCRVLRAGGREVSVRDVHARAMRKYGRGHTRMSIVMLQKKRSWLERCIEHRQLL